MYDEHTQKMYFRNIKKIKLVQRGYNRLKGK